MYLEVAMNDERNLYMYVYRMILTRIYNGTYKNNEKLPSMAMLCEQYHIGRNTLRSALLKLQKEGYVSMQKGTQAMVTFDVADLSTNFKYRQVIMDSKQMTQEVYETMIKILPDLFIHCIKDESLDLFAITTLISKIDEMYIHSEWQLMQAIYNVYLIIFESYGNPIITDLFYTLLSYSYQPISPHVQNDISLKRNIHDIKRSNYLILTLAHAGKEKVAKKMLVFVMKQYALYSIRYIEKLCIKLEQVKPVHFVWVCNRSSAYLYTKVVVQMIVDIVNKRYVVGDVLPSIAQLASFYDVSQRTIRKALDILREFMILEILNGLGSVVKSDRLNSIDSFIYTKEVIDGLKAYEDALELFHIIFRTVAYDIFEQSTRQELSDMADVLEHQQAQTILPIADFVFYHSNPCLYAIFEELSKTLHWGILANMLETSTSINFLKLRKDIVTTLRVGDPDEIMEACDMVIYQDKQQIQSILKDAVNRNIIL